jgi:hypothetical protein
MLLNDNIEIKKKIKKIWTRWELNRGSWMVGERSTNYCELEW